jgi:hypothetical protein
MSTHVLRLILVGLCSSTLARANSESFSTSWGPSTPAFSDTVSLPLFDSNLGTLTSAEITLTSNITGDVLVYDALSSQEFVTDAFASLDVGITGPDGATALTTPTAVVPSAIVFSGANLFSGITGTDSDTFSALFLADYESAGGGTLDSIIAATGTGTYGGNSVPGVFFGGSATAAGDVEITYNYVSVPDSGPRGFYGPFLGAVVLGFSLISSRRSRLVSCGNEV